MRTNADPRSDTGDTNAPVPFYVTTGGYGVLIDSARYTRFYLGRMTREDAMRRQEAPSVSGVPIGITRDILPQASRSEWTSVGLRKNLGTPNTRVVELSSSRVCKQVDGLIIGLT